MRAAKAPQDALVDEPGSAPSSEAGTLAPKSAAIDAQAREALPIISSDSSCRRADAATKAAIRALTNASAA
ncbi:MAG: hypothetical protein RJA70_3406 [Pseudomonadota bacterium]